MKKKFLLSILLCFLLISGCNNADLGIDANETSDNFKPTQFLDEATIPYTPKLLPTQTVTPHPTLTYQRQDEFFAILSNNGDCKLPCFWGIVPSITTWDDANNFLERYTKYTPIPFEESRATETNISYSAYIETTKSVNLKTNLIVDVNRDNIALNETVINMIVFFEFWGVESNYYHNYLRYYSISNVFRNYGKPENIYFDPDLTGGSGYSFIVVYDKIKMVIAASGRFQTTTNNTYKICPNVGDGDIGSLRIGITSTYNESDVKNLIGYPFWEGVPPFEEASGMSVEDFYKLMIGNSEQPICFEVQEPN